MPQNLILVVCNVGDYRLIRGCGCKKKEMLEALTKTGGIDSPEIDSPRLFVQGLI